jgi:hypothetical protein
VVAQGAPNKLAAKPPKRSYTAAALAEMREQGRLR